MFSLEGWNLFNILFLFTFYVIVFIFLEQVYLVPRLVLNSRWSSFIFLNAAIIGVSHHTQLKVCMNWDKNINKTLRKYAKKREKISTESYPVISMNNLGQIIHSFLSLPNWKIMSMLRCWISDATLNTLVNNRQNLNHREKRVHMWLNKCIRAIFDWLPKNSAFSSLRFTLLSCKTKNHWFEKPLLELKVSDRGGHGGGHM